MTTATNETTVDLAELILELAVERARADVRDRQVAAAACRMNIAGRAADRILELRTVYRLDSSATPTEYFDDAGDADHREAEIRRRYAGVSVFTYPIDVCPTPEETEAVS